jgi:hypothetical protein
MARKFGHFLMSLISRLSFAYISFIFPTSSLLLSPLFYLFFRVYRFARWVCITKDFSFSFYFSSSSLYLSYSSLILSTLFLLSRTFASADFSSFWRNSILAYCILFAVWSSFMSRSFSSSLFLSRSSFSEGSIFAG